MDFHLYQYEALDDTAARPYMRPARTIHELPTPEIRQAACEIAAQVIAKLITATAPTRIPFGMPVYTAFGMDKEDARKHPYADLLQLSGHDLPLSLLASTDHPGDQSED